MRGALVRVSSLGCIPPSRRDWLSSPWARKCGRHFRRLCSARHALRIYGNTLLLVEMSRAQVGIYLR